MKKIIISVLLNLSIIFFFLVLLPSVFIQKRQGTSIGYSSKLISLTTDKPVIFSFISNLSNLYSLSIDIKNPQVINNSPITFKIFGPNSQREIQFYGNNVGDPSSVPLKFTPFTDPPFTKYFVTLTTTNTNHSGLYIVTDNNLNPLFNSYYNQSNFKSNLITNFNRQLNLFQQRSLIHNILYIFSIILLNYLVLKYFFKNEN